MPKILPIDTLASKLSLNQNSTYQSSLLRKIVDRIRNSLELKVVIKTAVAETASLLNLDRCSFFWYFADTNRVQIADEVIHKNPLLNVIELKDLAIPNHPPINSDQENWNHGHPAQPKYYPLALFGSVAPAIAQGELVIKNSVDHQDGENLQNLERVNPQLWECLGNLSRLEAPAYLLVPVKAQPDQIGFISCLSNHAREWSSGEIEFMQSIAQQLEIAIHQAQLYEQTQKQAAKEKLVNQITNQTRQSFDLETILTQAIAQLLQALQVDRCLVHLVEEVNELSEVFRRQHLFEVYQEPFPSTINDFDPHGPITEWVIENRQPVIISDITQDPRIGPNQPEYQKAQIRSSLVLPVQANEQLHAILYLNQCSHVRYWSKNDQELAEAVADQLAISIQQAKLYAQTQKQAAASAAQAEYLAKTLRELQLTQAQLIQSEKLSSLGQLVAGVAHEINNPVSFIYGNIPYIERYVNDLIRLLVGYQTYYPQPQPELVSISQEVEIDFLLRDLPLILKSMNTGAERIREIVLALRNFSRLDEAEHKSVDIHTGLESTLLILEGTIKKNIQIIRNYAKLPPVECYPSQLNQVFMNILLNAIEALKNYPIEPKTLTIRTEMIPGLEPNRDWVRIAIADNGPGINQEIQSKIFDPFFTTKGIGSGSGLGLTVSYQTIVNQHQGKLICNSTPQKGTEFIIEIPVNYYNQPNP